MRSWTISTERLLGVSARLLAAGSVLSTIGLGLAIRLAWRQTAQAFGPDGTVDDNGGPFAQRLTLAMYDLNYRQVGVQLLLSSVLVGAAVLALHRNPSWARVRLIRWEVLVAGLVTFVPVLGLVLANLYVLTAPDDAAGAADFMGPQPLTDLPLGNLTTLVAAGLVLVVAALWWLRLGPGTEGTDDAAGGYVEESDEESDEQSHQQSDEEGVAGRAPDPLPTQRGFSDRLPVGDARDYRHDWSPEDFRRPS